MSSNRYPSIPAPAVAASPVVGDHILKSRWSDQSLKPNLSEKKPLDKKLPEKRFHSLPYKPTTLGVRSNSSPSMRKDSDAPDPVISISQENSQSVVESDNSIRPDKASRILGIKHRRSMEPIPASTRTSLVSTRSAHPLDAGTPSGPSLPLTSVYIVSGLPKSPHTWTLADPDSVTGLHHSESAVNRWWRPEVLGSTVSPGAGGGTSKRKRKGRVEEGFSSAGYLGKQDIGKILSKSLKLSFTREVEVVASTLQPPSTVHNFTFTLPAPSGPLAHSPSTDVLRASILTSTTDRPMSTVTYPYQYTEDPFHNARPSSAFLGPPSVLGHGTGSHGHELPSNSRGANISSAITYHGVCLTVWSHADAERTTAIRRTLESGNHRARKESAQSLVAARLKSLRADAAGSSAAAGDVGLQARRKTKSSARSLWGATTDAETDAETDADGAVSESDYEVASMAGHTPGESTLFLPVDSVFWLPYALTLVSRFPIYDLMRDYLTLSWARFSKDVQSHTLQISKILSFPAPRAGEIVRLDASAKHDGTETSLEVVARFPGGLDFGRGLVDTNFTMWPLFKCLNIDNILTICEIALSPTGRILFYSRHPAMLGIAVMTIKYIVELRGWNGVALPAVHSRDAKIYIEDPGPYIIGLATEVRYGVKPPAEVCVVDLDINYLNCTSPPSGVVSTKQQRDRYRQRLLAAFDPNYHSDHGVPIEFKEAFPAGRFRPVCKIQAKRGAASTAVADMIKAPEWWHSTKIIQAFDSVLQDKFKKPSLFKRISTFGSVKRPPQLSAAEQLIQLSIRKRATAFVDARDDLETKIGRLSRRLNFLMTESDLWRDKFVTFESYAEKLSLEASELRAKMNKEQKEAKRLSGLVTSSSAEKARLQNQLESAETAHRKALHELDQMRDAMVKMEQERLEMVAEVEAQIECALQSMQVDVDDDSDYESRSGSRPESRMSAGSGTRTPHRKISDVSRSRQLRSYGTESTLVDYDMGDDIVPVNRPTNTVIEEEEEPSSPVSPTKAKRFSAAEVQEGPQDAMVAVDQGINEKSGRIAQKVLQIQQKLETALAADSKKVNSGSESEDYSQVRPARGGRKHGRKTRAARGSFSNASESENVRQRADSMLTETESKNMRFRSNSVNTPPNNLRPIRKIGLGASLSATPRYPSEPERSPVTPALTPGGTGTTDDEDLSDFQSAYSVSPRDSYSEGFDKSAKVHTVNNSEEFGTPTPIDMGQFTTQRDSIPVPRNRAASNATATGVCAGTAASEYASVHEHRLSAVPS